MDGSGLFAAADICLAASLTLASQTADPEEVGAISKDTRSSRGWLEVILKYYFGYFKFWKTVLRQ